MLTWYCEVVLLNDETQTPENTGVDFCTAGEWQYKMAGHRSIVGCAGCKDKRTLGLSNGCGAFWGDSGFSQTSPFARHRQGGGFRYSEMVGKKWGETMMNMMKIDGYKAVITYDPEIDMFRGEFVGLNGGADFYATNIKDLQKEGKLSLHVFLDMCKEEGISPCKEYSGKFNLRVPPELHASIAEKAAAEGKSLNKCVTDMLRDMV